jgi:hypothetical protein
MPIKPAHQNKKDVKNEGWSRYIDENKRKNIGQNGSSQ